MITIKDIQEFLKASDMEYVMTEDDVLHLAFTTPNKQIPMHIICHIDEITFTMPIYAIKFGKITPAVLQLMNQLNDAYRYFRFHVDEDGDMKMVFDAPTEFINDPSIFAVMVGTAGNILEHSYDAITKAQLAR